MTYYQRRLPHWHPEGKALFVTWRLYGTLPSGVFKEIKENETGNVFALADRYLDSSEEGPLWLKESRIARQVCQTIQFGEQHLNLYKLYAFVVMANHVHLLIEPFASLKKIMRIIKRALLPAKRTKLSPEMEENFGRKSRSTIGFVTRQNSEGFNNTLSTILLELVLFSV